MKKFVMGMVVGAVLTLSVSVYADDVAKLIGKQVDNEYPVVLNGAPLSNKAPSIEGTSYAPVREISEKLGLNVDFKDDTVILTKKQEVTAKVPEPQTEVSNAEKNKAIDAQIYEVRLMLKSFQRDSDTKQHIIDTDRTGSNLEKFKQDIENNKAKMAELEKQKVELEKEKTELLK
jgi:hypothetical protein